MKTENIYDAIGMIDDHLIVTAKQSTPLKRMKNSVIAAAIVIFFATAAFLGLPKLIPNTVPLQPSDTNDTTASLSETTPDEPPSAPENSAPEYIKPTAQYLSYALVAGEYPLYKDIYSWNNEKSLFGYSETFAKSIPFEFYEKLVKESMENGVSENKVISPFSLFLALGIVSEMCEGESRSQILNTVGFGTLEDLRLHASSAWLEVYANGKVYSIGESGKEYCIPASSIWLNKTVSVKTNTETNDILKRDYYSSLFQGDPSNAEYINAFRDWLNTNTGGMLQDVANNSTISPDALMTIISTLYLDTAWTKPFDKQLTSAGTFYGTNGAQTVDFMHAKDYENANCLETPSFLAMRKSAFAGNMWFILPTEGITVDDVIKSGSFMDICRYEAYDETEYFTPPEKEYDLYAVKSTIPKFDVSYNANYSTRLIGMGIKDVFDPINANFSYFENTSETPVVSDIEQSVRYSINEIGVSAAAITRTDFGMGDPKFKYIDFTLDRPFMFLFTKSGIPLFAGVINNI